jgi:RHS repeat-associated protein
MRVFNYDAVGQLLESRSMTLISDTTCTNPHNVPKGDFGIDCADTTIAVSNQVNGYQYDSVGNLRQDYDSTAHVATLGTYLTGDRASAWGSTAYTYDADGNRITKTSGSHSVSYHWTPDGLLDTVTAGTVKLAYAYNAFGQLVRRSRNGVAERYLLWGRDQLLAELDGTATHRVGEYAYAPGTDTPIELITGSGTGPIQQYVQDGGGNVIGLFGPTSAITERQTYSPWGSVEAGAFTTLADTNRLRWKGLVWEGDSTQLYFARARWYDPASRRFISEDPIGLSGGINPYIYGAQDPVGNRDPSGMYISNPAPCQFDQSAGCGTDDGSFFGHGGAGGDDYTCNVAAIGAEACLEQAADFFSNGTPLGVGWNSNAGCNPDGNWAMVGVVATVYPGSILPSFYPVCALIRTTSLEGSFECGKGFGSCSYVRRQIGRCEALTYFGVFMALAPYTFGESAVAGAVILRTAGAASLSAAGDCFINQFYDNKKTDQSSGGVSP